MKVLVACEYSGIVRDAFIEKGHDAISCDILPTEKPGPHHQGYLEDFIGSGREWNLIIAHPPCTYLTCSAEWAYADKPMIKGRPRNIKPGTLIGARRREAREKAKAFFRMIWSRDCERICIENPVGVMSREIEPTQYIQPYDFGHDASKKTGLWLKGLPPLKQTLYFEPRWVCQKCKMAFKQHIEKCLMCGAPGNNILPRWGNQTDSGQNKLPPSERRGHDRSKTYEGWAYAMADQWGQPSDCHPIGVDDV